MDTQTTVAQSIAQILELATSDSWQDALRDAKRRLAIENIQDKPVTDEDKESLSQLLIKRIVQALKSKDVTEQNIPEIAAFIDSHVNAIQTDEDVKNFLYLLAKRWTFFATIPSFIYADSSSTSSRDEIIKIAQGAL